MFSFPLFERLEADAPEFEQLTAFQAGGFRASVRRPGVDVAARSLRTEYVTGNYFTTFGIGAFGGRVFTADDDTPQSPPVVVISHHSWQAIYGGDQSLVGQTLVIEGHPFTVAAPESSSTVWLAPAMKKGASFTAFTVIDTVTVAESSDPSFTLYVKLSGPV